MATEDKGRDRCSSPEISNQVVLGVLEEVKEEVIEST